MIIEHGVLIIMTVKEIQRKSYFILQNAVNHFKNDKNY